MARASRRLVAVLSLCVAGALLGCGKEPESSSASPTPATPIVAAARCPVCGDPIPAGRNIEVEAGDAGAKVRVCSHGCAIRFEEAPEKFGGK